MQEALHPETAFDSLTGLKDRMTFSRDITQHLEAGERSHMILIKLSQLKGVNRKYGVPVGNQLLQCIAHYLEGLDPDYSAYRFANSRLLLIGPECSQASADAMVKRIRTRFEGVWQTTGGEQEHTIRTKVLLLHLFLEPEDTENDLLAKLNYGLTELEQRGVSGTLFFGEELRQAMERQKYILGEVRYAIRHKTFQIYYQPIYNGREKKFTSAESLIRLTGRDGIPIRPDQFIPMAEENGLIDQISWIVLEKVCCFLGAHPELPLNTVSVNLTGQQILDPTFPQRIETLLETSHLDGSHLRIEITERTTMEDLEEVKHIMTHLAELGIRFYLDDFGTGYSNLSNMLSLPFEVVKFDKTLIDIMDATPQRKKTIGLLAEIMHENHYIIVAEGIERQCQADTAAELGLDRIQGYFYAKPLPEEELLKLFAEHR